MVLPAPTTAIYAPLQEVCDPLSTLHNVVAHCPHCGFMNIINHRLQQFCGQPSSGIQVSPTGGHTGMDVAMARYIWGDTLYLNFLSTKCTQIQAKINLEYLDLTTAPQAALCASNAAHNPHSRTHTTKLTVSALPHQLYQLDQQQQQQKRPALPRSMSLNCIPEIDSPLLQGVLATDQRNTSQPVPLIHSDPVSKNEVTSTSHIDPESNMNSAGKSSGTHRRRKRRRKQGTHGTLQSSLSIESDLSIKTLLITTEREHKESSVLLDTSDSLHTLQCNRAPNSRLPKRARLTCSESEESIPLLRCKEDHGLVSQPLTERGVVLLDVLSHLRIQHTLVLGSSHIHNARLFLGRGRYFNQWDFLTLKHTYQADQDSSDPHQHDIKAVLKFATLLQTDPTLVSLILSQTSYMEAIRRLDAYPPEEVQYTRVLLTHFHMAHQEKVDSFINDTAVDGLSVINRELRRCVSDILDGGYLYATPVSLCRGSGLCTLSLDASDSIWQRDNQYRHDCSTTKLSGQAKSSMLLQRYKCLIKLYEFATGILRPVL
ncbi:hypothetical protein BASA61_007039 [Batrachochytrium salamandrivorans]|nr:hypothetical protein BASA61_007039 [Batrachochytrium salamandrivorans]